MRLDKGGRGSEWGGQFDWSRGVLWGSARHTDERGIVFVSQVQSNERDLEEYFRLGEREVDFIRLGVREGV